MKKLIIFSIIIITFSVVKAQNAIPTFKVTPAEIDALTENVTIIFDVTGTAVEGLSDVYIWAWAPGLTPSEILLAYDEGSPDWNNISENAKLDPVEGETNKFMLSLPKTVTRAGTEMTFNNIADLFGVSDAPGKIKEFGFLLRSQDGNKQTPGEMATSIPLLPLEFEPAYFRTFPSKVSNKDVVSAYLNLMLIEPEENSKLKIAENITAVVKLLSAENQIILTSGNIETNITDQGEYTFTFLPEKIDEFPEGTSINDVKKCIITFSGTVKFQDETTEDISTRAFEIEFQEYE